MEVPVSLVAFKSASNKSNFGEIKIGDESKKVFKVLIAKDWEKGVQTPIGKCLINNHESDRSSPRKRVIDLQKSC